MDEYAAVKGQLKLRRKAKGTSGEKKVKTTPPASEKAKASSSSKSEATLHKTKDKRTAAEIAFDKRRMELQMERVMKKAEKSHKQRVDDFNDQLDKLSEFNDIPKVSWTK